MSPRILIGLVCIVLAAGSALAQPPTRRVQELARITTAIDVNVKRASPEVQRRANEVPAIKATEIRTVSSTQNPAQQIQVVSDQQRNELITKIKQFADATKKSQNHFYALALSLLILGIALALCSSVLGFVKMAKAAGIVSLVVAAIVAFPRAYPVPALADFYSSLAVQALALQTDCELKSPMTVDEYKASAAQLKTLILYEAQNKPGFGETNAATDVLTKQMQELRTLASEAKE